MKAMMLLFLTTGLTAEVVAQIPNAGFENWTSGNPSSWATSNAPPEVVNIRKVTVGLAGAAVTGYVITYGGDNIPPILQSGPGGAGFAVSVRYASVTGWYQMSALKNDYFDCIFHLLKSGTPIATAAQRLPNSIYTWTRFNIPFTYFTSDVPDLCILRFQIASTSGPLSFGSNFHLDEIAFSGVNHAGEVKAPLHFTLEQNFPNPFNPSTLISYELPVTSHARLAVFDLLGQEIAVLVNGQIDPGRHEVKFYAGTHPSGLYVYRLVAGSFVQTRTMTLVR
jgi:hypothetical protein